MRNISPEPVLGKVWATETYVHVRWVWLILPMALAPASMLFLLTAIWPSGKHSIGIWKSSGLATLFHGLESASYANDLHRQSEMEDISKELTVQLLRNSDGTQKLVSKTGCTSSAAAEATAKHERKPFLNSTEDTAQHAAGNPQASELSRDFVGSEPSLAA